MGAIIKHPEKQKIKPKHIALGIVVLIIFMIGMGILGIAMSEMQPK